MLSEANPRWKAYMDELEASGLKPKTNPDGDVRIQVSWFNHLKDLTLVKVELEGASYDDFVIPLCELCLKSGRREPMVGDLKEIASFM
jgi:NAD+-dependent protein deacetylase sirtuin 4